MAAKIGPESMLAEWLFVNTVDDVRRRSQDVGARNRYDMLGIAPLLRKLLIDGRPLLNTVRAVRKDIPTDFRIKQWSAPKGSSYETDLPYRLRLAGPELVGGPEDPPLPKLDHFLRAKVGMVRDQPLTVRGVVKYYANVEGGVHFGVPEDAGQRGLHELAPLLLGQSTGQIEILAHLGTIVVDALTPLRQSILSSPLLDIRMHQPDGRGFFYGHWSAEYYEKYEQGQ